MRKINKKAEIETGYIISLLLVLAIVGMVLFYLFGSNFTRYFNFLPSFTEKQTLSDLNEQEQTEIESVEAKIPNCNVVGEFNEDGVISLISSSNEIKNPTIIYLYGDDKENSEIYINKEWNDWKLGEVKNGKIIISDDTFLNREVFEYISWNDLELIENSQISENNFLCKIIETEIEKTLTEEDYEWAANELNVDIATIKAVAEVESSGGGFNSEGKPKILFEGHIFWKRLIAKGVSETKLNEIQEENKGILYKNWGDRGNAYSLNQYDRLEKAKKLSKDLTGSEDSAYESASWGKFQILGVNYKESGFSSASDYVFAQYENEFEHLRSFVNYVKSQNSDIYLQNKEWENFAKAYNGSGYKVNKYDTKLKEAYEKYSTA